MITHAWFLVKTCLHASHFYALNEHNNYYLSGTRSEQVTFSPSQNDDPYPVSVKAHVENVFFNVSITKRRWKDQWHGLNVIFFFSFFFPFFFCCSNNVKMQVYSAQTNKNLCLRFWVSPSLTSVSFKAKLAWLIIVFSSIKMVNSAFKTLL